MTSKKVPIAVLISDVHYSLNTLELADAAFRTAIEKAKELNVPLIDCGDVTNDKAIIRAEVMNRLIATVEWATPHPIIFLVGNHSLINEKQKEHALGFLTKYENAYIVDRPEDLAVEGQAPVRLFPYYSDGEELLRDINRFAEYGDILIFHQGVHGAFMGDYAVDKSAVDPARLNRYQCFSGHYHKHQTVGPVTYVGNPYTLTFGEANDGPKGFLVLYSDGSFDQIPLNLRKHIKFELVSVDQIKSLPPVSEDDLTWVKITDTEENLSKVSKKTLEKVLGVTNFKFDKVYTEKFSENAHQHNLRTTPEQTLDALIDSMDESPVLKNKLKTFWRELT